MEDTAKVTNLSVDTGAAQEVSAKTYAHIERERKIRTLMDGPTTELRAVEAELSNTHRTIQTLVTHHKDVPYKIEEHMDSLSKRFFAAIDNYGAALIAAISETA